MCFVPFVAGDIGIKGVPQAALTCRETNCMYQPGEFACGPFRFFAETQRDPKKPIGSSIFVQRGSETGEPGLSPNFKQ